MKRNGLLVALVAVLLVSPVVDAGSLWKRRQQRSGYLFTDARARRVGDVVTVRVLESTAIDNEDERDMAKTTDSRPRFDLNASITPQGSATHSITGSFDARARSERRFAGSSEFESDRLFSDQISCTVTDIMPNGNLMIEGIRKRVLGRDIRVIRVAGVIRPEDVGLDNTIESRLVANFVLAYEGRGDGDRFTNQNWGSRKFNRIWPW